MANTKRAKVPKISKWHRKAKSSKMLPNLGISEKAKMPKITRNRILCNGQSLSKMGNYKKLLEGILNSPRNGPGIESYFPLLKVTISTMPYLYFPLSLHLYILFVRQLSDKRVRNPRPLPHH